MTLSDRHSTPLGSLLHAYANRFEAARAWQRNSGKVVGYISTAVPRELISAAGMLPLLITGDPRHQAGGDLLHVVQKQNAGTALLEP